MNLEKKLVKKIVIIGVAVVLVGGAASGAIIGATAKKNIKTNLFEAPTAITGLTYDTNSHKLLNPGSCEVGTIYYLNNNEWSETIPEATNAGIYTTSWYIKGDKRHKDYGSTETPLTINTTIEKCAIDETTLTAPKAKRVPYSGESEELISECLTTYGTAMYSLGENNWQETIPTAIEKGKYTVNWYVKGDENYKDYGSQNNPFTLNVTIGDEVIMYVDFMSPYPQYYSFEDGVVGEPVKLMEPGFFLTNGSETQEQADARYGDFYYSVNGGEFSTEVPTADKVGFYEVRWYISEGPQTIGFPVNQDYVTEYVVIDGKDPEAVQPKKITAAYTGADIELCIPGTCDHGTFYYSLNGENWSTSVPTAKEVGTYDVYWYLVGDEGYSWLADYVYPDYLTSKISA